MFDPWSRAAGGVAAGPSLKNQDFGQGNALIIGLHIPHLFFISDRSHV